MTRTKIGGKQEAKGEQRRGGPHRLMESGKTSWKRRSAPGLGQADPGLQVGVVRASDGWDKAHNAGGEARGADLPEAGVWVQKPQGGRRC